MFAILTHQFKVKSHECSKCITTKAGNAKWNTEITKMNQNLLAIKKKEEKYVETNGKLDGF